MQKPAHIVSTRRCLLRQATSSDYDSLAAAISTPEFPAELPLAGLHRQGKLKAWFDSIIEMSTDGKAHVFSVDLRTGERCIGQVSLVRRSQSGSRNLAFWLHPSYWGSGLAQEAARAVVQHAFTVMSIEEIWAGAARWNERSIKTLLKLGLMPIQEAGASTSESRFASEFRAFSASRDQWMRGAAPKADAASGFADLNG